MPSQNLALLEYKIHQFSTHIPSQRPTNTPKHAEKEHFEMIALQLRNLHKNKREVEMENEKGKGGHSVGNVRVPADIFNI